VTNSEPANAPRAGGRLALHAVAVVLSALVIVALVRVFRRDGPAALEAWRAADVQWAWVTTATLCALAGHAIYVVGWQRLLRDLDIPITFWQAARYFLVSNLGRYLPGGKAWQMGIVGVMAAENQQPAGVVAATSLLQGIIGVAVGAIMLFATGGAALGVAPVWFAFPLAGVAGLVVAPALLRAFPRVSALVVKRLPGIASVSAWTMWALVWTSVASWIGWGVALYALGISLLGEPGASLVTYISAWIGPFLAGLIAIVTPAGLGVRDGAMQGMLGAAGVPASSALVLVVVTRVWVTLVEVVPAIAVLALRRRRSHVDADAKGSEAV
jgi:uncharacterized membrane protein YbhN (UPF0104 family)